MSYDSLENSVELGQPVELFLFFNLEARFAYTSAQHPITFNGDTYQPRPIKRSEDTIKSLNARRDMTITMPATDLFAQRYIATIPTVTDTLRIFRYHTTDGAVPEVVEIFNGSISNVAISKNNEVVVNARSMSAILEQSVPRQTCRALCNHIIYNARCKVNSTDFQIVGVVDAIAADGMTVDVNGGGEVFPFTGLALSAQFAADSGFLLGGTVERFGLERRMIRSWTNLGGNVARLGLLLPFAGLTVGQNVQVLAGCDQSKATCRDRFDNTLNFGGFPLVPKKNPFDVGIEV